MRRQLELGARPTYNKLAFNAAASGPEDLDHYVKAYSQSGTVRCDLGVYRAFLEDAEDIESGSELMGSANFLLSA